MERCEMCDAPLANGFDDTKHGGAGAPLPGAAAAPPSVAAASGLLVGAVGPSGPSEGRDPDARDATLAFDARLVWGQGQVPSDRDRDRDQGQDQDQIRADGELAIRLAADSQSQQEREDHAYAQGFADGEWATFHCGLAPAHAASDELALPAGHPNYTHCPGCGLALELRQEEIACGVYICGVRLAFDREVVSAQLPQHGEAYAFREIQAGRTPAKFGCGRQFRLVGGAPVPCTGA